MALNTVIMLVLSTALTSQPRYPCQNCGNCQISMITIENASRHSIDCILPGRRPTRACVYIDISRYGRMSHISVKTGLPVPEEHLLAVSESSHFGFWWVS